jgi:hypothetical protein
MQGLQIHVGLANNDTIVVGPGYDGLAGIPPSDTIPDYGHWGWQVTSKEEMVHVRARQLEQTRILKGAAIASMIAHQLREGAEDCVRRDTVCEAAYAKSLLLGAKVDATEPMQLPTSFAVGTLVAHSPIMHRHGKGNTWSWYHPPACLSVQGHSCGNAPSVYNSPVCPLVVNAKAVRSSPFSTNAVLRMPLPDDDNSDAVRSGGYPAFSFFKAGDTLRYLPQSHSHREKTPCKQTITTVTNIKLHNELELYVELANHDHIVIGPLHDGFAGISTSADIPRYHAWGWQVTTKQELGKLHALRVLQERISKGAAIAKMLEIQATHGVVDCVKRDPRAEAAFASSSSCDVSATLKTGLIPDCFATGTVVSSSPIMYMPPMTTHWTWYEPPIGFSVIGHKLGNSPCPDPLPVTTFELGLLPECVPASSTAGSRSTADSPEFMYDIAPLQHRKDATDAIMQTVSCFEGNDVASSSVQLSSPIDAPSRRGVLTYDFTSPTTNVDDDDMSVRTDTGSYSSCTGDRRTTRGVFTKSPMAGEIAQEISTGWNEGLRADLTAKLAPFQRQGKYISAYTYYHESFLLAVHILEPYIAAMPGGDYFFRLKR